MGGLRDTQLAAHRRDVLALGQQPIGRHQLAHNLLGTVPLPRRHDLVRAFLPTTWAARLSHTLDQLNGVRPIRTRVAGILRFSREETISEVGKDLAGQLTGRYDGRRPRAFFDRCYSG